MNIVIDNIEQFKAFFDVIYDMSSELVELQLHTDRMVCAMLDRTKTRFFHVVYNAEFFKCYDIDEDIKSITVFVEDIHNLLKSTNKKDTLYFEVNDPYLVAKIESDNGNKRLFEFVLPTDFVDSPVPPHAEFPAVFEVDTGVLKQSVKDISLVGTDLFKFIVNDGMLTLTSDNESSTTKYANTIEVELEEPSSMVLASAFSLEYVSQMLKFDKISKRVTLKLGSDLPVFYTFEDALMGVTVNGMIAPRISED